MDDEYYEFDNFTDVETSVEALVFALKMVDEKPAFWKVAVNYTHLALQGSCVCLLTKTDRTGPFKKRSEEELRKYLNQRSENAVCEANNLEPIHADITIPKERLADLWELLERLPSPHTMILGKSISTATTIREKSLLRVIYTRNDFAHFVPMSFYLHVADLQSAIHEVLLFTLELVQSPKYQTHNRFPQTRTESLLLDAIELLENTT